jgi:hypothetical protein
MAKAIWGAGLSGVARLYYPVFFDVRDAGGSCKSTMAAE